MSEGRTTSEIELEGRLCPSCLNHGQSKGHEACVFMTFDCTDDHDPYAKAAMLAYARACAKDKPEVARVIRMRIRLHQRSLGAYFKVFWHENRCYVSEEKTSLYVQEKTMCGALNPGMIYGRCTLIRGHGGDTHVMARKERGVFENRCEWKKEARPR